jgi:hypothetical protein
MNAFRAFLYWLARAIGDYQAVAMGPQAIARRLARKSLGRTFGRFMRRL